MTEGMPRNELVRRAFEWILSERSLHPSGTLRALLDEAGMRFNLTPKDDLALNRLLQDERQPDQSNQPGESAE